MTDKELLKLAAKAVSIPFNWVKDWAGNEGVGVDGDGRTVTIWNPLAYDGDALRLAVKLGFAIFCPDEEDPTIVVRDYREPQTQVTELAEPDFLTATRRAIVRAAAEIGKGL